MKEVAEDMLSGKFTGSYRLKNELLRMLDIRKICEGNRRFALQSLSNDFH